MGMFDHYVPVPDLSCKCGARLGDWQGKDGPCELLTWTQLEARPTNNAGPKERRLTDGVGAIYTECANCARWVDAYCVVKNGIWATTRLCSEN